MAKLRDVVPASLRKTPLESSDFARSLVVRAARALRPDLLRPELRGRATRMTLLPRESEDSALTGGTRSLDRRLLGLNLRGTLKPRISPAV